MKILYIIFASLLFNHTLFLTQLSASCPSRQIKNLSQPLQNKIDDMISAATKQVGLTTIYNPSYKKLKYPMGDPCMKEFAQTLLFEPCELLTLICKKMFTKA